MYMNITEVGNRFMYNSHHIEIYVLEFCNRTTRMYKELAHTIMEVAKSQPVQGKLTSWSPRRSSNIVPVQRTTSWRHRKNWYFSLSPKAEKSWCFSLKAIRQKEFSYLGEGHHFGYVQASSWLDEAHSRRPICFTQSIYLNYSSHPKLLLQKHPEQYLTKYLDTSQSS